MTKEDFEIEFYRFLKTTKDREMLGQMAAALEKRMQVLRDEVLEKKEQEHDAKIKRLKAGEKVLVRFGELANQTVEIVRHGSKRTTVRTESGEVWHYSRRSLIYNPQENDFLTAKTNQQFRGVVARLGFNNV